MSDHGTPAGDERSESLTDWYRDVRLRLSRGVERSAIGAVGRRAARATDRFADVVRGSWLYRWLTAEPEPEVIVIDLRETYTVGPFIRLLDRLLEGAASWADSSRAVSWVTAGIDRTTSAPLRIGGAVLALAAAMGLFASLLAGGPSTTVGGGLIVLLLVGALATRENRSWSELRETRPVRLLAAAFEPPDPPESAEPTDSSEPLDSADSEDDRDRAG